VNVSAPDLPAGSKSVRLTGHTAGTANNTGLILVSAFGIVAVPWDYNVSFTLTDFPLVCPLASCTCSKHVCATKFGPLHEPIFMHMHLCLLITLHIAGSLNCCHAPRWQL